MTPQQRQIAFWIGALILFAIFLDVFSSILLPFVAGMGLAYLFDPLTRWIERRGFGRPAAIVIIVLLAVIFVVIAAIVIVPILINEATNLIGQLPTYVEKLQGLFQSLLDTRVAKFFGLDPDTLGASLRGMLGQGATFLTGVLKSVLSSGLAVLDVLSLLLITPVVAVYLLYDWQRLIDYLDSLLPRDHVEEIRALAREINVRIAAFVRGQGLICIILAVIYAVGLTICGISFGFLLGVAAGILSFIPYVGTAIGIVGGVGLALAQYWPDWVPAAGAVAVFALGQALSDYFFTPKLIGDNVGLHPVWVIFSFFAFAALFGFLGLIIAIPAAAAIGVVVRYAISLYLDSPIYRGKSEKTK